MRRPQLKYLLAVLLTVPAVVTQAGEFCCAICGCHNPTTEVCHLVCETKKVPVVCYGCKEEDFCVPGPSTPGELHCETICESSLPCATRQFAWRNWSPSCSARVFTRKKLLKRTVMREVPSYKWITEDMCKQFAAQHIETSR